ncbi:MAG: HlyC/CorC family transporter [Candidatus Wallbacteria bacterium]|nr:HlyC/CorC family transporter [Candidatus Wallbacteria bacterium]
MTLALAGAFFLSAGLLFLFNGLESALVRLSGSSGRGSMARLKARLQAAALSDPERLLAFAVTGSVLASTAAVLSAAGFWFSALRGRELEAAVVAFVVTVPVLFVLCETLPRHLFRKHSEELLRRLERPLAVAYRPFGWLLGLMGHLLWEPGGAGGIPRIPLSIRATREELQLLLARGEQTGLVGSAGRQMISGILEARHQNVAGLMQRLVSVVSCPETSSTGVLVSTVVQSGFTRIPVWSGSADRITAVVHATDLLPAAAGQEGEMSTLLRKPLRVAPSLTLVEMLALFKSSRGHLAIVEAEPGKAIGLLTIEDVLERIIGEIKDEHDPKEAGIRQLFQDTFLVDAVLDLGTVNRRLGLALPAGDYDTLSGFLLWLFRKIPSVGNETSFHGVRFFVTKADDKLVEQAIVKKLRRP